MQSAYSTAPADLAEKYRALNENQTKKNNILALLSIRYIMKGPLLSLVHILKLLSLS